MKPKTMDEKVFKVACEYALEPDRLIPTERILIIEVIRLREERDCWISNAKGLQQQVNEYEKKNRIASGANVNDRQVGGANTVPESGGGAAGQEGG